MTRNIIFCLFTIFFLAGCKGSSAPVEELSGTSNSQVYSPKKERKPDAEQVKVLSKKLSVCFDEHWKPTFEKFPKNGGTAEERKSAMYMTSGIVLRSCLISYFNIEELKIMTDSFEKKLNQEIDIDAVATAMIKASWKELI
jgi:hypothetical protein